MQFQPNSKLNESIKLVEIELALLKHSKNNQNFTISRKFNEIFTAINRSGFGLTRGNDLASDLISSTTGAGTTRNQSGTTSFTMNATTGTGTTRNDIMNRSGATRNGTTMNNTTRNGITSSNTTTRSSLNRNSTTMNDIMNTTATKNTNSRRIMNNENLSETSPKPQKSFISKSNLRSKSQSKNQMSLQDLQVKFYEPTSSKNRQYGNTNTNATNKTDLQPDFIIPNLNAPSGTRTGLLRKEKVSEMEKMRRESDERLARSVRNSNARQKAIEAEQKRKVEKEKRRYKNITSKVQSSAKAAKSSFSNQNENRNQNEDRNQNGDRIRNEDRNQNGDRNQNEDINQNEDRIRNEDRIQNGDSNQNRNSSLNERISSSDKTRQSSKRILPNSKIIITPEPLTRSKSPQSLQKNTVSTPKSTLVDLLSKKMQSVMITNGTINQQKSQSKVLSQKKILPERPGPLSSAKTPVKKTSAIPSSIRNATPPQSSSQITAELVEKVIAALGSKLDPFLQSVQHHLERSAIEIDSNREKKLAASPIKTGNATALPEKSNEKGHVEHLYSEIKMQNHPKTFLVKNDLDEDDIALIMDMNEPSILYHDEISQNQAKTDDLDEIVDDLDEIVDDPQTHTIYIQNEVMNRARSPIMFTANEKQEPTDLHNVILLSDWVMEDIIFAKETRRKWVNLYYGPNFDPAAVIGSVSEEIMIDMIDNIGNEVGEICGEFVNQVVQMEF